MGVLSTDIALKKRMLEKYSFKIILKFEDLIPNKMAGT